MFTHMLIILKTVYYIYLMFNQMKILYIKSIPIVSTIGLSYGIFGGYVNSIDIVKQKQLYFNAFNVKIQQVYNELNELNDANCDYVKDKSKYLLLNESLFVKNNEIIKILTNHKNTKRLFNDIIFTNYVKQCSYGLITSMAYPITLPYFIYKYFKA